MEKTIRPAANEVTQRFQQRNATEYEVTARAFTSTPFAHEFKHQFLVRLWQIMWPDFFVIEKDGILNSWCLKMAKAFCSFKRLSLVGCASSTKSQCAAMYGYTMWKVNPEGTSVYLSTTSAEAGEARMWGVIKDLFSKDRFQIGKRIDSLQLICLDAETKDDEGAKQRDFRDVIKFVKIKTGNEGRSAVGSICGRKNKRVLWICDELNFMELGIMDARVNLFSNPFAQFIGIGNAPTEGSPLYMDAEPVGEAFPDGYRSVDIEAHDRWKTKTGVCFYFNGAKSPNFEAPDPKKPPFPFMMNAVAREEIREMAGGDDTNVFWVQFYGFPPGVEVSDKVVDRKFLESHRAFEKTEWAPMAVQKIAGGMDCGFREGGDPSVIDFAKVGKDVSSDMVVDWINRDGKRLHPIQNSKDGFEKQMAIRAVDELVANNCHDLAIDISGDGGMTATAIKDEVLKRGWKLNLIPVSFMGSPDDRITVQGEKRTAKEMFDRKVSQLWMNFREAVRKKIVRGCSPHCKAIDHLCSRRYKGGGTKKFSVEQKKEMKKRLGRSPDEGDARVLTLLVALGMGAGPSTPESRRAQDTPRVEPASVPRYSGHATRARYSG